MDIQLPTNPFDLMTINTGVKVSTGAGFSDLKVNQLRIELEHEGNSVVFKDGTICPLKVPSGAESGIKLTKGNAQKLEIKPNTVYDLSAAFDPTRDIHYAGGRYILHPELKITKFAPQQ